MIFSCLTLVASLFRRGGFNCQNRAEARTGELVATMAAAPNAEQLSAAVSQYAERAVERWDNLSANMQERMSAAEIRATELGHDDLAALLYASVSVRRPARSSGPR